MPFLESRIDPVLFCWNLLPLTPFLFDPSPSLYVQSLYVQSLCEKYVFYEKSLPTKKT